MRKLFLFCLATLMSASMFASLEQEPSNEVLNGYAEAGQNVVYAIFVEDSIKCNDIVLVGTYNGWTADAASCSTFVAVEGFAGWYVCCVADASEDIQARPVQLDGADAFNWDYQVGALDQTAVVRGIATIEPSYFYECSIKAISDAAPLLINVKSWKTNPCTAKYHDYVITLVSPDCNELEYITPAISGGFNSWAQDSMTFDNAATYQRLQDQLPGAVYKYTAYAAEGTTFRFRSAASWGKDWTNELREFNSETSEWQAFNGGQNFTFAETTELVYDLGDPTLYSWTNCERPICDSMDYTIIVTVPACENSVPQLVGSFDGWGAGVAMTATGVVNQYSATVRALCVDEFKFNDVNLGWDNDIKQWNGSYWQSINNIQFGKESVITLDYSDDSTYCWSNCEPLYQLTVSSNNNTMGSVSGSGEFAHYLVTIIAAVSNMGYHFVQWSDGDTDNPRSITLTQDTAFVAEFAKNSYTITTSANYPECGYTMGDTTVLYQESVTISAVDTLYGYHFARWDDGNTSNPRAMVVTQSKNYQAIFEPNQYLLTTSSNGDGSVSPTSSYYSYLSNITLTATPNFGYHFEKWADGNTDNPRYLAITQDTSLVATFAKTYLGQCGKTLYWSYNKKELTITGSGKMYNFTSGAAPWALFQDSITSVLLPAGCTSIGSYAFANCKNLMAIHIPANVEEIGAGAFAECRRLYDVYCYALIPPFAETSSFNNYNVYLYIPCDNKRYYELDAVFGSFKYLECIGATTTQTDTTQVEATETAATFTWPANDDATTYELVIKKDDVVFCVLVFNSNGQLINISFAPSRNAGERMQNNATQMTNGFMFTVTSLESGVAYTYSIDAKDDKGKIVESTTGSFETPKAITTAVENVSDNHNHNRKVIRNGILLIERNGVYYNAQGAVVE